MNIRVRIAPSPTGYPHIATIWQALINFAFARKNMGQFIVRIEDTDQKRLVKDAEEKLFSALSWFGLKPDESPNQPGKFGPYRQSERLPIYQAHAQKLVAKGKAYYCFCSPDRLDQVRKEMVKKGFTPMYDGHCQKVTLQEAKTRISRGEKYVIRLKVPKNQTIVVQDLLRGEIKFDSQIVDDQVLLKSDGWPTYHLAATVDDHLMQITHVVRGEEWLSSAPKHVLLYDYFGWEKPIFIHTPILRNPDHSKLSKRQGHTNVSWYQEQGYLAEAILNLLCLLGWSHPQEKTVFPLSEFIKLFDLKDLSVVGPIFDLKKLDYLNGVYIRNLTDQQLLQLIKKYCQNYSLLITHYSLPKIIPLIKQRMVKLADINELIEFFITPPLYQKNMFSGINTKIILQQVAVALDKLESWTKDNLYQTIKTIFLAGKYNKKEFYVTLYQVIEGKESGLPLFESLEILGKKESLKRIQSALDYLG